jgi:COX assembly mitochondrial protein 1
MLSISFACRPAKVTMNKCMAAHATPDNYDVAREEWFAGRVARARERQRTERRKLEQEQFHREWWGLPSRDADDLRREEERLGRAERIGGFRSQRGGENGSGGGGGGGGGAASR